MSSLSNFPRKFKWPPKHHHPRCNPPPPPPHRHRLHHLPDIIIPYIVHLYAAALSSLTYAHRHTILVQLELVGTESKLRMKLRSSKPSLNTFLLQDHPFIDLILPPALSPFNQRDSAAPCQIVLPRTPTKNPTLSSNLLWSMSRSPLSSLHLI